MIVEATGLDDAELSFVDLAKSDRFRQAVEDSFHAAESAGSLRTHSFAAPTSLEHAVAKLVAAAESETLVFFQASRVVGALRMTFGQFRDHAVRLLEIDSDAIYGTVSGISGGVLLDRTVGESGTEYELVTWGALADDVDDRT
jgi:hypothetical protein